MGLDGKRREVERGGLRIGRGCWVWAAGLGLLGWVWGGVMAPQAAEGGRTKDRAAVGKAAGGEVAAHAGYADLKKALRSFVRARGGGMRSTLLIPRRWKGEEDLVVFWVEKRALFTYPLGPFRREVFESPGMLNMRFWELTAEYCYPADSKDPGHHSSTFMITWEWAREKVFEAVKDGHLLVVGAGE